MSGFTIEQTETKRKTDEQRLADLQAQVEREKKRLAYLRHKESEAKRKLDAHQKIKLGGAVLKTIGRPYQDGDEEKLISYLENNQDFKNFMNL